MGEFSLHGKLADKEIGKKNKKLKTHTYVLYDRLSYVRILPAKKNAGRLQEA
jgi:hypothetical protein